MSSTRWHTGFGMRLGLAAITVLIAFAVRYLLDPFLGDRSQFIIFVLPVLVSATFLGRGPAIGAAVLSLAAGWWLLPSHDLGSAALQTQLLLFAIVCAGIIWLSGKLATQSATAAHHRQDAEKRSEEARIANEELRLLLEGARQYAIFMVDPDGTIITWNSGAERIYGWSEGEILGRHCSLFYAVDVIARESAAAADLAKALAEDGFRTEEWQVRKDGSEFVAAVSMSPVRSEAGELRGFARVIHDITERRAAETAVQKREEHLRSILATVPDAMIVIDHKGIITSFSAAAERLFGYREGDVLGQNVKLLMPDPDRKQHDSYIERYLATNEPHIIGIGRIVTGLRADGSTFPMKLSVGEAISSDQRVFTGFVQDLTEKRDFETKLEQARSELIHVSRLSAMGTMASTLAHELNQPLAAISAYGEAVREMLDSQGGADTEILREVFTDISEQALRAGNIVRRLRQFVSRGEVSKSIEDLPALINEASALALVGARDRGVTAQFFYATEATPVFADRVQIQQVLVNLMRNAMEAMEDSPVRKISVSTTLVDPKTVQVSVADTGSGIAPEMRDRLFEAFASTKDDGMGLGLSICRTIIEAHGGRISVHEAQGGGTEFRFTLNKPPGDE